MGEESTAGRLFFGPMWAGTEQRKEKALKRSQHLQRGKGKISATGERKRGRSPRSGKAVKGET